MSSRFAGPVFLVGMPRSGTKLLRELLNRHSEVAIPRIETEFLPWLDRHIASFGDLSDLERFRSFHRKIVEETYFRLKAMEGQSVDAQAWHAACRDYSAAGVFEALIRLEVGIPFGSSRIWGDKSPSYVDDIPLIKRLYPQARVVHIVRDVRDYCLSIHKAWGKDMLRAAQRWADGVDAARAAGAVLGADYLELHYEDLLTRTDTQMRRLSEFLGIGFEPETLSLDRPSENIGDTRGATHVVADNHGKFAKLMEPAVLSRVEELAAPTLLACGYQLVLAPQPHRRLSKLEMLTAQLKDGLRLARAVHPGSTLWKTAMFHFRHFLTTRA